MGKVWHGILTAFDETTQTVSGVIELIFTTDNESVSSHNIAARTSVNSVLLEQILKEFWILTATSPSEEFVSFLEAHYNHLNDTGTGGKNADTTKKQTADLSVIDSGNVNVGVVANTDSTVVSAAENISTSVNGLQSSGAEVGSAEGNGTAATV